MPRPPPPETALTKTGKPMPLGRLGEHVEVGAGLGAVQGRQPRLPCGRDRPRLVAGEVQDRGRGTDEGDPLALAGLGEQRVLGEEAVAGIDRVGARLDGLGHDRLVVEVGPHGVAGLADLVGLVGLEAVLGLAVLVREDGDGAGAELGRGAEGADGDLTSVGDEDLAEHQTSRVAACGRGGLGRSTPTSRAAYRRCAPGPRGECRGPRRRCSGILWVLRDPLGPAG